MLTRTGVWSGLLLWSGSLAFGQAVSPDCSCRSGRPGPTVAGPQSNWPLSSEPLLSEWPGSEFSVARPVTAQPIDQSPLQIVIPERVLNRLLTEQTADSGPIRDVIAQADVIGEQQTTGQVHVDCRPSADRGEIHLVLQGIVNSDTVGWTSQAAVSTVGRHQVHAIKPVMFDGYQITTRRPKIWVDVQNHNVAARTPYDGIPILDWIAQSTVRSEVRRRQAWADSDTAASVAERLGPKFNRDADRRLAKLNRRWRDEWMSQYRELWPKSFAIRTTDSEVQLSASWPDAPALTAAAMKSLPNGTHHDEITIRIHESVLNSALNRLPISGKAFSEKQLRTAVETLIAYIGGKIEPKKSDDDEPVLENVPGMTPMVRMAKETPVRVKIEDGTFRLIVKAGIELAGQTILAEDEISMPLTLADKQLAWRVDPGNLSFAKADNGMNVVGMVDTIVRNRLADAIPSTSYPKSLPVADPDLPIDSMRMTRMQATTGWLTISFDAEPRDKTSIREQEYQIPRQTSPVESQPPAEVVPPRLLPVPDNEIPDTTTARRPSASRVTARAVRVPTHSPVPINNTWATFDRNASTRTRVPSDFLR